jgi:hypothetical protein
MNLFSEKDSPNTLDEPSTGLSRRTFFKRATVVGASTAVAFSAFTTMASALNPQEDASASNQAASSGITSGDTDILIAAEIAEALAVTTYTNIINKAPFFKRLPDDDQNYLYGARQEEMSHYALEESVTGKPSPFTSFYYPKNMFMDALTTLNTLVTLEDAFIAAYLVGVRNFSNSDLRVTAARIMGIESDHRTLARVLGNEITATDGGPFKRLTGAQGVPENIAPPNNNGYERTLCWTQIGQAVQALLPFVDETSAKKAGFDTTQSFPFAPFTSRLPNPLGAFFSFKGC